MSHPADITRSSLNFYEGRLGVAIPPPTPADPSVAQGTVPSAQAVTFRCLENPLTRAVAGIGPGSGGGGDGRAR